MTGWKTKAAGYLAIAYGIAGLILGLHDMDAGVQFVVNGLGLLGIGHKIEKAGEAAAEAAYTGALEDVVRREQKTP